MSNIFQLMFQPLRKYATFSGRAQRAELWLFNLFFILALLILSIFLGLTSDVGTSSQVSSIINEAAMIYGMFFYIAMFIPCLAVSVRRLHDLNLSGWFCLITFIPLGSLVLLIMFCLDGTEGDNDYGPDPKNRKPRVESSAQTGEDPKKALKPSNPSPIIERT